MKTVMYITSNTVQAPAHKNTQSIFMVLLKVFGWSFSLFFHLI